MLYCPRPRDETSSVTEDPPLFTVFTSTYNRAHTLHRVWDSLMAQTSRRFEWLVVDDGSTDRTRDLIEEFASRSDFPILYVFQQNAGKHVAWNRAVSLARGRYFLVLDSDDGCVPHALEAFEKTWSEVEPQDRFAAVVALSRTVDGRIHGTRFPLRVSDHVTMTLRYRLCGEKWECWRTAVLRRYPFPEEVRGVLPESYLLNRVARRHLSLYLNEALRIYYEDTPSLTRQIDPRRQSQGQVLVHAEFLNLHASRFFQNPSYFVLSALKFARHARHLRRPLGWQFHALGAVGRFLLLFTFPIAWIIVCVERFCCGSLSGRLRWLST